MSLKSENISGDNIIDHANDKHEEYDGNLPDSSLAVPFRFMVNGPFNIRGQAPANHYKTFLGEQKT